MATSQWGNVVKALQSQVAALPGYRLPSSTTSGTTVYAGPAAQTSNDPGNTLTIGWSAGDLGIGGSYQQIQGPLAAAAGRPRDEIGEVVCVAHCDVGGLNVLDALGQAETIVAGVEGILRADPTLGLVPPLQRLVAELTGSPGIAWTVSRVGPACDITFTIMYQCRI